MVDRTDRITILLYLADAALIAVVIFAFPSVVTGTGIVPFAILLVILGFPFAYAAYWAFDIRKSLAVGLYRNQAFGIGLMCITYVIGSLEPTGIAYSLFLLVVFYWIDASFKAARRSDPLVRDPVRWSKLRIPLWIANVVLLSAGSSLVLLGFSNTSASSLSSTIIVVPFFLIAGSGVALGLIVTRRTTDQPFRKQIAWFALFVFAQFVIILVAQVNSISVFVYFFGFVVAGFCMYKSARSLVPLNRISLKLSGQDSTL